MRLKVSVEQEETRLEEERKGSQEEIAND